MKYHNTTDIKVDLKRAFDKASQNFKGTLRDVYEEAITDAFKLGYERGAATRKTCKGCSCGDEESDE